MRRDADTARCGGVWMRHNRLDAADTMWRDAMGYGCGRIGQMRRDADVAGYGCGGMWMRQDRSERWDAMRRDEDAAGSDAAG